MILAGLPRLYLSTFCQIHCGAQFSVALSREGTVYTWGKGEFYRLGHGTDTHVRIPQVVEALIGTKIVKIGVGSLHCLALSSSGEVSNTSGTITYNYLM